MVKKPINRIASKPGTPPPEADSWVKGGGVDPELQPAEQLSSPPIPQPDVVVPDPPPPGDKGKPYPHRISFDTTKDQYKRLKRACFEEDRSLNEAIREAVEDWLKLRNY